MRWAATLACNAARAFAVSLLGLKVGGGADGDVPRVLGDPPVVFLACFFLSL